MLNASPEMDMKESSKERTTFLTAFENNKGRNKVDNKSKSHSRHRRKHNRCKSGISKLSKRNNMNKSALDQRSKAPKSIENRVTSQSMYHSKKTSIVTSDSGRINDFGKKATTGMSNIK